MSQGNLSHELRRGRRQRAAQSQVAGDVPSPPEGSKGKGKKGKGKKGKED